MPDTHQPIAPVRAAALRLGFIELCNAQQARTVLACPVPSMLLWLNTASPAGEILCQALRLALSHCPDGPGVRYTCFIGADGQASLVLRQHCGPCPPRVPLLALLRGGQAQALWSASVIAAANPYHLASQLISAFQPPPALPRHQPWPVLLAP